VAWQLHPDGQVQVNGRWLRVGSEVSIKNRRGKYRYTGHALTQSGQLVLNFIGGPPNHEMMRSFYPDQIKTVHHLTKHPPRA